MIKSKSNIVVLCDFDGTATPYNVINMLYKKFAAPYFLEINQKWIRGEISTQEKTKYCFSKITATRKEMEAFLNTITLDPGFCGLIELCKQHDYKFAIVSDGLEWYIKYILNNNNIKNIIIYAGKIYFKSKRFQFSFPWYNSSTPLRSTSKFSIIRRYQAEDFKVVFIGDGLSDTNAVKVADIVYAKGVLMKYCSKNHIPAIEISNLSDLLNKWKSHQIL